MPDTFQGLTVVLIALLPGGLFLWAVERLVGHWGIEFSDRLLRFIGVSAVLHLAAAPATYIIWHDYLREGARSPTDVLPLWLWGAAAAYILIPVALGTVVGKAMGRFDLPELLVGSNPAPTAWDHVFFTYAEGYLRLKLKSGPFIGGALAAGSYTAGFPNPADIYVSEAVEIDPDTGEFARNANGQAVLKGYGFLIRWDEVEYLDFAPR